LKSPFRVLPALLATLFAAVAASLRPGGLFLFTLETMPDSPQGYTLNPTGRYAHSVAYVGRMAARNGLSLLESVDAPVRMELLQPVAGAGVVLRKN